MSSPNVLNRLSKAKSLLAQFDSQQLVSQNFVQVVIVLKGLKFIEDPDTGQKPSYFDIKFAQFKNAMLGFTENQEEYVSVPILMRNNGTILQIKTFIRQKLKEKYKNNNFQKQGLHIYCNGRLIAGNESLTPIKEIVKKYETNKFICERTEVFG